MITVSTKIDLYLTAEIDRIRNYGIFGAVKGLLQTISNEDKFIKIRQNAGIASTIEATPGLALINGVIVEIEELTSVDLLGLPDGNYRVKIAVDNSQSPATGTLIAENITATLFDDDLTEVENGKADLVMATMTLSSSNVGAFTVVAKPIPTIIQIYEELIEKTAFRKKYFTSLSEIGTASSSTFAQIFSKLNIGEAVDFITSPAAFAANMLPTILESRNITVRIQYRKISSEYASIIVEELSDSQLKFATVFSILSWSKLEWTHQSKTPLLFGTSTFSVGANIPYDLDNWDSLKADALGSIVIRLERTGESGTYFRGVFSYNDSADQQVVGTVELVKSGAFWNVQKAYNLTHYKGPSSTWHSAQSNISLRNIRGIDYVER